MEHWRVIVGEQDGVGGSNPVEYWFYAYDDAHRFYAFIKNYKGMFPPHIKEPPNLVEFPHKIHAKNELTVWEKNHG
jgi:hypothetical protein